jgi:Xaa-Pro dipeptidase
VALVFPLEGSPTAFVVNETAAEDWAAGQDWFQDIRNSARRWGQPVADNLRARGFERGRLGITGLLNYLRAPEGVVPWGSVQKIVEAFPHATIHDATDLIMRCRMYKSEEEVALIRQADLLAEQAAAVMVQAAAEPDATEAEVQARMHYTLARQGGQPSMILFHHGPPTGLHLPSTDPLQPGDVLMNEIEAKVHGYCAQVCQPVAIGPGTPAKWRDNFQLNLECWGAIADRMRPGVRLGEVWKAYVDWVESRGYRTTGWIMHCRGLGEDKPGLHGGNHDYDDWEFAANQTYILKPSVLDPSIGAALRFGDTVVVTEGGAKRLGVRPPELSIVRE